MCQSGIRDRNADEHEFPELLQTGNMCEAGVRDGHGAGILLKQSQEPQIGQSVEMCQPGVGDFAAVVEVKFLELLPSGQPFQTNIRDPAARDQQALIQVRKTVELLNSDKTGI